jgi:hypothetical protein
MNDDVLEQLRIRVRAPTVGDKVTIDKRLKAEILLMRSHASVVEDKPGSFIRQVFELTSRWNVSFGEPVTSRLWSSRDRRLCDLGSPKLTQVLRLR